MNFKSFYKVYLENNNDRIYLELSKNPEKNKETIQKMVDDAAKSAGYNIGPVWHGSRAKGITVFDPRQAGTVQKSDWGKGIYFSTSKSSANNYRDIATRYSTPRAEEAMNELEKTAKQYGTTSMMKWIDMRSGKITEKQYNHLEKLDQAWRDAVKEAEKQDLGQIYKAYIMIKKPYNYVYGGITEPGLSNIAKERGCDAVIIRGEEGNIEEILVFDSNQIKSADAVTYDNTKNVIPLSQRFDSNKDDIRY